MPVFNILVCVYLIFTFRTSLFKEFIIVLLLPRLLTSPSTSYSRFRLSPQPDLAFLMRLPPHVLKVSNTRWPGTLLWLVLVYRIVLLLHPLKVTLFNLLVLVPIYSLQRFPWSFFLIYFHTFPSLHSIHSLKLNQDPLGFGPGQFPVCLRISRIEKPYLLYSIILSVL